MEEILPILLAIGGVAFFVLFFVFIIKQGKKNKANLNHQFSALAEKLGVDFIKSSNSFWAANYPKLQGLIKGKSFLLQMYAVRSGKTTIIYTTARLYCNAPVTFRITREGFLSGIGKAFGMQDIEIGDPEIDDAYIIKCSDKELPAHLFDQRISALFKSVKGEIRGTLELKANTLSYTEATQINNDTSREKFERMTTVLLTLGEKLEEVAK